MFLLLKTDIRLKLTYVIKDDTGTAAVTFWDSQARQLMNKTALEMIAELPEVVQHCHYHMEMLLYLLSCYAIIHN